jgi:Polysaccharide deacetylase
VIAFSVLAAVLAACSPARPNTRPEGKRPPSPTASQGTLASWRSFPDYRDAVPVVTYHSVGGPASDLTTSRALFAAQMAAFKAGGFHTLTMRQYVRFVQGDRAGLPPRPILLTFDDGRRDAYLAADPILRSDGFHAVEFVVPGWVTANPGFSLSWAQIRAMAASGIWDIEEHFGYGHEYVQVNAAGQRGGEFGHLAFVPGRGGTAAHLETFAQFRHRVEKNMLWGETQLREHLSSFQPLAVGVPEGDYGQGIASPPIAPFVLSWLRRHFDVVFGGDYLAGLQHEAGRVPGRFSTQVSYRLTMGPLETLPVLRCRLLEWVQNTPITHEYHCLRIARLPASSSAGAPTP